MLRASLCGSTLYEQLGESFVYRRFEDGRWLMTGHATPDGSITLSSIQVTHALTTIYRGVMF